MDAATLHEVAGLAARVENAAASLKGAALAHAVCVEDVADEDGTIRPATDVIPSLERAGLIHFADIRMLELVAENQ